MESIESSLDDISRPASSGSRVSSPTTPLSLTVLTNDPADMQDQSSSEENIKNSSPGSPDNGQYHVDVTDEEDEDSKLQRAIDEMTRLDEILSENICKEKEVKRQGKELKEKLLQELLNELKLHSESVHEAETTKLLALEVPSGLKEEDDSVPVFETQPPVQDCDRDIRHTEQSDTNLDSTAGSSEVDQEETVQEQSEDEHCGAPRGKKKRIDFVKKNIELASGMGGQVLMTQAERERLAELLRDTEEEEEDDARGADGEAGMRAVSILTGPGYTPEPSELQQLIEIDSKLRFLLPDEELLSVQSSYTNLSVSQGPGSEAGWELDGDPQPGEKVLQDIRERQEQERRLQEIQQQLEILDQGQEMTHESPRLTEEQLLCLLDECEQAQSRIQSRAQDVETGAVASWDPSGDADPPCLSEALLSKLLQDLYTTSFSSLENGTCKEYPQEDLVSSESAPG